MQLDTPLIHTVQRIFTKHLLVGTQDAREAFSPTGIEITWPTITAFDFAFRIAQSRMTSRARISEKIPVFHAQGPSKVVRASRAPAERGGNARGSSAG